MGVSSIIVGDFGLQTTPADLPPSGLLPVDWDGPGNPAVAYQMKVGESLYYDKPLDPLDGHLFQYIGVALDPTGWLDIGLIQGPQGPTGDVGPTGPPGSQYLENLLDVDVLGASKVDGEVLTWDGTATLWKSYPLPVSVVPNEVYISPTDPLLTDPAAELWYDTSVTPGVLKANNAGVWEAVTPPPTFVPSEVEVADVDPLSGNPAAELWFDTSSSLLNANVAGVWMPAAAPPVEEVFVGPDDPYTLDPTGTYELWFDEDGVTSPFMGEEVHVGPDDPDLAGTNVVDLWYDTDEPDPLPWGLSFPRVVCRALVGTVASHATASTMGNLVTVNGTFYPDRTYHIFASVRAIQDPGALIGLAQFRVAVGTVQMEGYDCVSGPDSGLWGAWSNTWLKDSVDLGVTAATPLDVTLDLLLNAAAKTVYAARIYVIEYPGV
jgi:hypothetical protein